MKASEYRGEKQFVSVPGESIKPARNEVRLDVVYCGICGTDIHIYQGHMDQRVKIPQIIGHELSARIGEIGSDVDDFEVGEIVTIRPLKPGQLVTSDKGYKHINQNLEVIGVDLAGGMQSSL
ncbi:MAG: alcohol dehydrogenase catalytic domain-containing protein, partial [Saprospiraceae bacterium]|nr:alcohol dehydrogenase catalytic domain-containing protein [Saprospiraceae bacterium]